MRHLGLKFIRMAHFLHPRLHIKFRTAQHNTLPSGAFICKIEKFFLYLQGLCVRATLAHMRIKHKQQS